MISSGDEAKRLRSSGIRLAQNAVHIWCADLAAANLDYDNLAEVLQTDELDRARRYRFDKDRRRFIAGRAFLRYILGGYLDLKAEQLHFSYNRNGKPALTTHAQGTDLTFNTSHSHGVAIYAVARSQEVGIDIEYIASDLNYESIAEHIFSVQENLALHAFAEDTRRSAFYAFWTRREAYIKARGLSIASPMPGEFSVAWPVDQSVKSLVLQEPTGDVTTWSFHKLDFGPSYAATLAVAGTEHLLIFM
jgi:4'-phosphopantetheinyl transferase